MDWSLLWLLLPLALGVGFYGAAVERHDHSSEAAGGILADTADRPAWYGLDEIVAPTAFPAANSVVITNIPQTYGALILVIDDMAFDINNRSVFINASTDNGNTFPTGKVSGHAFNANATFTRVAQTNINSTSTIAITDTQNMVLRLTGYQAGKTKEYSFHHYVLTGSPFAGSTIGTYDSIDGINALKIVMTDTGNFAGGTYALYGAR